VRAAAAEVTGKLEAKELIAELQTLMDDTDGFVVKNALEALRKMGAAPEPDKLVGLAQRHAGLRGEAVEMLVNSGTDSAVKAVTDMYKSIGVDGRLAVLDSLKAGPRGSQETTQWQSFLAQAAVENDPRLRRAVAEALGAQPATVAAALVGSLLSDEDGETRSHAAGVVLSVIGRERVVASGSHGAHIARLMEELN